MKDQSYNNYLNINPLTLEDPEHIPSYVPPTIINLDPDEEVEYAEPEYMDSDDDDMNPPPAGAGYIDDLIAPYISDNLQNYQYDHVGSESEDEVPPLVGPDEDDEYDDFSAMIAHHEQSFEHTYQNMMANLQLWTAQANAAAAAGALMSSLTEEIMNTDMSVYHPGGYSGVIQSMEHLNEVGSEDSELESIGESDNEDSGINNEAYLD